MLIKLTEIKSNFVKYNDLMNSIDSIFEKQKEILNNLNELEESIKNYLLRYFKELNNSYVTFAQEIKMKKADLLRQKQDFEVKLKAKEEYEKTNNIKELQEEKEKSSENADRKELETKLIELTNQINKINDEKNYNKNQIELLESNSGKIDEMKENCDILEKTKKLLETAKEQFSSHYLEKMKNSFVNNLKLIGGKEMEVSVDVNLNVKINECGSNKEIDYFSTGYRDLIYICMRLSLIDSLFENEKPFIILDDPFVNLDEGKIANAIGLLNSLAKKYQIVYFVCHESRSLLYKK